MIIVKLLILFMKDLRMLILINLNNFFKKILDKNLRILSWSMELRYLQLIINKIMSLFKKLTLRFLMCSNRPRIVRDKMKKTRRNRRKKRSKRRKMIQNQRDKFLVGESWKSLIMLNHLSGTNETWSYS